MCGLVECFGAEKRPLLKESEKLNTVNSNKEKYLKNNTNKNIKKNKKQQKQ